MTKSPVFPEQSLTKKRAFPSLTVPEHAILSNQAKSPIIFGKEPYKRNALFQYSK